VITQNVIHNGKTNISRLPNKTMKITH